MAAQERLVRREAGDTVMHGDSQPTAAMADMHASHGAGAVSAGAGAGAGAGAVAAQGVVSFPVAIPSAGRYRIFVQVRRMSGVIETAALDVDPPIFASVNISSRQLLRHDLLHDVKQALGRHRVLPQTLKLELTESLVMENPEYAAQMLTRIRALGAGLSLDDFGTGWSSLAYLRRFPFDQIKMDRGFLRDLGTDPRVGAVVNAIISLGQGLGMTVVAEGIETEEQAWRLLALGCERGQGWHLGRPAPAEQARSLIAEEMRRSAALA
jgi:EAL domain-containing protein (putative c-di-GMP-specific phosphodiesterase class I)